MSRTQKKPKARFVSFMGAGWRVIKVHGSGKGQILEVAGTRSQGTEDVVLRLTAAALFPRKNKKKPTNSN